MTAYKIKSEKIDELYNLAEEVFGNISLIKAFCENYYEEDDFYKLKHILRRTYKVSDTLYAEILDITPYK